MDLDALESKEAELRAKLETERSVFPTLSNLCERLDEQLWKAFQRSSHKDIQYLIRLQDEQKFLFMLDKVIKFLRDFNQNEYCSRVGIIKLTYIYYKNDSIYAQIKQKFQKRG